MALRVGKGEGSRLPDDGGGEVGPGNPVHLPGNLHGAAPGRVEKSCSGWHLHGPRWGDGGKRGALPEVVPARTSITSPWPRNR